MALRNSKKRAVGLVAGTCLVAVAPFVSGCTDDKKDDSGKAKPSRTKAAEDSSRDAGSSKARPGAGQGKFGKASSAQEAVTRWVTAVVENKPDEACEVMVVSPGGTSDAEPKAVGKCGKDEAEAKEAKKRLSRFHTTFTPEQPRNPPQVNVGAVRPSGSTAKVDGERITVDGQSLNAIVVSNSQGVEKGQVDVQVKVSRVENGWYVTDLGLSVG
ncbi:hypothetical protein [Streptomyces sp. NBC_01187]|uniref:hypothetical protein n=1 Tax=Streptomyces sp. NBC_01187 TaxID=2903766 RepID=UPI00386D4630|nr:hypothetical protein OG220_32625 [Streptomyces sp. NBC_01187]